MSIYKDKSSSRSENSFWGWCGVCYKIFEGRENSHECQKHLKLENCDKYHCSKNNKKCLRKFANIEDEQNHAECLSLEDVKNLDESFKIQNHIQKNNMENNLTENTSLFFINNKNNNSNPWETRSEFKFKIGNNNGTGMNNSSNKINKSLEKDVIKSKLNSIFSTKCESCTPINRNMQEENNINNPSRIEENINNNLNFDINKYANLSTNYVNEISNQNFFLLHETVVINNHSNNIQDSSINSNKLQRVKQEDSTLSFIENFNRMNFNSIKYIPNANKKDTINCNNVIKESDINKNFKKYFIADETGIKEIFEIIYYETKISKKAIKLVKSEFKKRGWTNAKMLRLIKGKYKNWEFLYDSEIKSICSQSEAICIYLENLLKKTIDK